MSTSQSVLPSFSANKKTNFDTTRCQLLSSSLWGSPISISSFSSSPKMSLQFQTRRRLRVTAMAPPKAKPGGKAKKGNFTSIHFNSDCVFSTILQFLSAVDGSLHFAVVGMIKLALEAGKATPAPPVGPALGSKGVNIMAFCKDYNARTADKAGYVIPVEITVYDVSLCSTLPMLVHCLCKIVTLLSFDARIRVLLSY